jgi:hypothetical protein
MEQSVSERRGTVGLCDSDCGGHRSRRVRRGPLNIVKLAAPVLPIIDDFD